MPTPSPIRLRSGAVVYRVQYRLAPGANPTSDRFDTYQDALNFCALIDRVGGAAAREIREATSVHDEVLTMRAAFEEFCLSAESHAEAQTVAKYKRSWERHIGPVFDAWPIQHVARRQVEDWVRGLRSTETVASIRAREDNPFREEEYLSGKTIANLQGLLSSVFRLQVDRGVIDVNPARGVRLPSKQRTREPVFLTPSQRGALIDAAHDPEWKLYLEFMLATGVRWSESLALTPADFDLESTPATVRIDKAWKRTPAGLRIGPPKTKKSRRAISLPAHLVPRLRALAAERGRGEFMWQGASGGPVKEAWFRKRVWGVIVERAGVEPAPRVHDLRHTHASMLLAANVPIHVVQQRLGHESIQTTVNVYGHLVPEAGALAAQAVQAAMMPY